MNPSVIIRHPVEAIGYYQRAGIRNVVCEKKHMGSRAVIVLCRTPEATSKRFGINDGTRGIICATRQEDSASLKIILPPVVHTAGGILIGFYH